ncbi:uncharacterized protein LOC115961671 [Quercus lobata]|uniref:uncharacterized protein LOC115961671 n=1 Tax=Quercus lobata TaxID=97700 RepID=UPI001246C126|nr:uncharacterized protein LOC115961671 [Quercus lobata]
MADDVIDSMENMKLTSEEEEIIVISDEGRLAEIESCNLSLIGKFLTCRAFNKRAAMSTIRKAWGMNTELKIVEVGSNLFQFKFQTDFDLNRVLKGGPWSFDNQLLLLKRWHKGMTASNVKLDHASLWIQIWGAPFDMVSSQVAAAVGSRLGMVEDVEKQRGHDTPNYFMRVRVAIPVSKPLRRGGFIEDSDGERTWVKFKYERLPVFCYYCGILGHDLRHCASHFAAEKQGGEVDYQYGDWLKVTGGRQRSPPQQSTVEPDLHDWMRSTNENHGVDTNIQVVESEKLGVDTSNHVDNVEVHEMNPNIQQRSATGNKEVVDMDNNSITTTMAIADESPKSQSDRDNAIIVDEQIRPNLHGTAQPKLKSTWTRIMRMDYGLGSIIRPTDSSLLGKRGSFTKTDAAMSDEEGEAQRVKREKLCRINDGESAGVADHPCRRQ